MEKKTKKREKSKVNLIVRIVLFIVLLAYSMSLIMPLIWGLSTSLKSYYDFSVNGGNNVIGFPTLDSSSNFNSRKEFFGLANYITVFKALSFNVSSSYLYQGEIVSSKVSVGFFDLLLNTILYCGIAAVGYTFSHAVVAFLCAKYKYKFSSFLYLLVVATMAIPVVGANTATLKFVRAIGIYDTWFQHFCQVTGFTGMYFLVFYGFYQGMPDSYIEAAEIDGASQLRTFINIIVPMSSKMLTTVMLLIFVQYWNEYTNNLIYLPTHPTLAYGVYFQSQKMTSDTTTQLHRITRRCASCMMLALPLLVAFAFLHKKLMGNVSLGGIKE